MEGSEVRRAAIVVADASVMPESERQYKRGKLGRKAVTAAFRCLLDRCPSVQKTTHDSVVRAPLLPKILNQFRLASQPAEPVWMLVAPGSADVFEKLEIKSVLPPSQNIQSDPAGCSPKNGIRFVALENV